MKSFKVLQLSEIILFLLNLKMKKLLPFILLVFLHVPRMTMKQNQFFSLIVDSSEGGYVSSTGGDYEEGSLVSVSAIANDGYVLL